MGEIDWRAELDAAVDAECQSPPPALRDWVTASPDEHHATIGLHHDGRAPVWTVTLGDDVLGASAKAHGATLSEAVDAALQRLYPTAGNGTTPNAPKPAPTPTTDSGAS